MKQSMKADISRNDEYEKIVRDLFELSGFEVGDPKVNNCNHYICDLYAFKNSTKYCIEVKSPRMSLSKTLFLFDKSIQSLIDFSKNEGGIPVFIIFSLVNKNEREYYKKKFSNLIIYDLANILSVTKENRIHNMIVSKLNFSIDELQNGPQQNDFLLDLPKDLFKYEDLKDKLDKIQGGKLESNDYEKECKEILQFVFSDTLSLWLTHQNSNDGLYQFDLVCRIKDDLRNTFFSMMEHYFASKYVVFEFKNYNKTLTQKEIYTTERYLYRKALRNVAIMIIRKEFQKNTIWAIKGSLRENGKLILIITDDDLKRMIDIKLKNNDPSEVLLEKLDELLIELEK